MSNLVLSLVTSFCYHTCTMELMSILCALWDESAACMRFLGVFRVAESNFEVPQSLSWRVGIGTAPLAMNTLCNIIGRGERRPQTRLSQVLECWQDVLNFWSTSLKLAESTPAVPCEKCTTRLQPLLSLVILWSEFGYTCRLLRLYECVVCHQIMVPCSRSVGSWWSRLLPQC